MKKIIINILLWSQELAARNAAKCTHHTRTHTWAHTLAAVAAVDIFWFRRREKKNNSLETTFSLSVSSWEEKHSEIVNSFIAPWTSAVSESANVTQKLHILFFSLSVVKFIFIRVVVHSTGWCNYLFCLFVAFSRVCLFLFWFWLFFLPQFSVISLFSFDWLVVWFRALFSRAHNTMWTSFFYRHFFLCSFFDVFFVCCRLSLLVGCYCARAVRLCLLHDSYVFVSGCFFSFLLLLF